MGYDSFFGVHVKYLIVDRKCSSAGSGFGVDKVEYGSSVGENLLKSYVNICRLSKEPWEQVIHQYNNIPCPQSLKKKTSMIDFQRTGDIG